MSNAIPILMYHSVSDEFDSSSVNSNQFLKQMNLMKKLGYKTINLSDLNLNESKKQFVITFDDGYFDVFKNAIPTLNKLNFKATIFIVSDFLNNNNNWDKNKNNYIKKTLMNDNQIVELINKGHEIGSHTLNHIDLTTINDDELEKQIYKSKQNIEKRFNIKVVSFSYPYGSYNENVCDKVRNHYKFAVTTKRSRYKINKFSNHILPRVPINSDTGLFKFYIKIKTFYEDIKFNN